MHKPAKTQHKPIPCHVLLGWWEPVYAAICSAMLGYYLEPGLMATGVNG